MKVKYTETDVGRSLELEFQQQEGGLPAGNMFVELMGGLRDLWTAAPSALPAGDGGPDHGAADAGESAAEIPDEVAGAVAVQRLARKTLADAKKRKKAGAAAGAKTNPQRQAGKPGFAECAGCR